MNELPTKDQLLKHWNGHRREIHHRAQGYVYFRSLDIESPAFYER